MRNVIRLPVGLNLRSFLRFVAAVFFIYAGINHFRKMEFYERMIPPAFPPPKALVVISGVCEIIGGIGLLIRPLRRIAGIGLLALLVAVFPANVYMAWSPALFAELHWPTWFFWLRLPLQGAIMAWVYYVALAPQPRSRYRSPGRLVLPT